jgi:uncharacterized protein YpuA (DUF1002 family)
MKAFLVIDTEDKREKIEVTNTQINSLTPIIKKINKNTDYKDLPDSLKLLKEILTKNKTYLNIEDITSVNITYHN